MRMFSIIITNNAATSILLRWLNDKESTCQWRRCRRSRFDPWVRKMPWRRKWENSPVFLPEKSREQRSLTGYSPWSHRVRHDQTTEHSTAQHSTTNILACDFWCAYMCTPNVGCMPRSGVARS